MGNSTNNRNPLLKFENFILLAKGFVILCAFLAFALSMRQKEFDRFSIVKPIFEIDPSIASNKFSITNHGGIAYFVGCGQKEAWQLIKITPRQFSTLSNKSQMFEFSNALTNGNSVVCYWRDVDLNTYEVKVIFRNGGFYIDNVPVGYRSKIFYTMSSEWLDAVVSCIFPKNWFKPNGIPPKDDTLIVRFR